MSDTFFDEKEVALWLRRYSFFSAYIQQKENSDKPIKEVFAKFAKENGILEPYYEAYITMTKINLLYSNLTVFSYLYDNANNYWLVADIEKAIQEKPDEYGRLNRIFIDGSNSKKFDRKVIMNIRNALNHCENKELFRISKDCDYIEINLKNGEFHVKMDWEDLAALIKIAMENMRNFPLVILENEEQLDYRSYSKLKKTLYGNLRYRRTFNRKKYETRFEELIKATNNPEDIEEFLEVLKEFEKKDLKIKSKSLSRGQLDFIMKSIAFEDERGNHFYNSDYAKNILPQLVYITLPIGVEKITTINTLNEIYNKDNWEKSYMDIIKGVMTSNNDIGDYKKVAITNGSFLINFSFSSGQIILFIIVLPIIFLSALTPITPRSGVSSKT